MSDKYAMLVVKSYASDFVSFDRSKTNETVLAATSPFELSILSVSPEGFDSHCLDCAEADTMERSASSIIALLEFPSKQFI